LIHFYKRQNLSIVAKWRIENDAEMLISS